MLDALRHFRHALGQCRIVGVDIVQQGLEVQHGRGNFHAQLGTRNTRRMTMGVQCLNQRMSEGLGSGQDLVQGVGHQGNLVADLACLVDVATGQQ